MKMKKLKKIAMFGTKVPVNCYVWWLTRNSQSSVRFIRNKYEICKVLYVFIQCFFSCKGSEKFEKMANQNNNSYFYNKFTNISNLYYKK